VSVLLDTGIVYAYYDRSDDWHKRARAVVQAAARGLVLPAPVIPEVDYLLGQRIGAAGRRAFFAGLVGGHYLVADVPRQAYPRIAAIDEQFADLSLGFVDAAIVALAERLRITQVATTDRRHFAPLAARFSFTVIP
jgi:predicted nucleic acid-binding protein